MTEKEKLEEFVNTLGKFFDPPFSRSFRSDFVDVVKSYIEMRCNYTDEFNSYGIFFDDGSNDKTKFYMEINFGIDAPSTVTFSKKYESD